MKTSTPSGGICALFVAVTAAAATPAPKADSATPAYIRPFGLRETRWTEGQWARQQSLCFTQTIPSVRRVIDKPGSKAAFTNFKLVAGLSHEAKGDCRWGDGDVYKYLEALCYDLAVTGDAELDRDLRNECRQRALRDASERPDETALPAVTQANREAADWMRRAAG
jgi:hypothetical protein